MVSVLEAAGCKNGDARRAADAPLGSKHFTRAPQATASGTHFLATRN